MPNTRFDIIKAPASILPGADNKGCSATEDRDTYGITERHIKKEDRDDKLDQEQEILKDSKQNREQRKEYANKIFWLVCGWLVSLVFIVILVGFGRMQLSDTVLVALISGASLNIIGLMVIVAQYLFPKNGMPPPLDKKI